MIFDAKSVYGYTTDLSEPALRRLADTLAAGVSAKRSASAKLDWRVARQADETIAGYRIARSPRQIPLADKIALASAATRARAPSCRARGR